MSQLISRGILCPRDVSDFNKKNIYDDFLGAHPELEEVLNRTILVHQSLTQDYEFKESIYNNQKIAKSKKLDNLFLTRFLRIILRNNGELV